MTGTAMIAGSMGIVAGIHRRGESFRRLAAYHLQAHAILVDRLGVGRCWKGETESEIERIYCSQGPEVCRAYKASMYHWQLSENYRLAAERPWLPLSDDPPPPPDAHPEFEIDPLFYELVSDDARNRGLK
jgi:hypothetical protein